MTLYEKLYGATAEEEVQYYLDNLDTWIDPQEMPEAYACELDDGAELEF